MPKKPKSFAVRENRRRPDGASAGGGVPGESSPGVFWGASHPDRIRGENGKRDAGDARCGAGVATSGDDPRGVPFINHFFAKRFPPEFLPWVIF